MSAVSSKKKSFASARKSSFIEQNSSVKKDSQTNRKAGPQLKKQTLKSNLLAPTKQEKPVFDKDATKRFNDMLDGDMSDVPPLPKTMVKIFLSSTFSDMREERNALARVVYPDLRDYCASHDLDFQVVDMRWGVTEDSINDHSVENLCLLEVKNCQKVSIGPNFIVLAGNRYGFRPIPVELSLKMFEILRYEATKLNLPDRTLLDDWFKLDQNAVPNVYVLQPIRSKFTFFGDFSPGCDELRKKDTADWWKTFESLQGILRKSASAAFKDKKISAEELHQFFLSVTECEIQDGILNAQDVNSHCLVYRREFEGLQGVALMDKGASRFIDVIQSDQGVKLDEEVTKLRQSLGDKIKKSLGKSNIKVYHIYWMPMGMDLEKSEEHRKYIHKFCDDFYTDCRMLIEKAKNERQLMIQMSNYYTGYDETVHHLKFCLTKCESFCGQEKVLQAAKQYILDQSGRKPLVIHAESGHGKTAIMAMIMKSIPEWLDNASHVKVIRFLGTSPQSNNVYDVLFGVLGQLSDAYDLIMSPVNYRNWKKLTEYAPRYLRQIAGVAKEPVIILLDSLDQLYPHLNAYSMDWLPLMLPQNVKLIVSTLPREHGILTNLRKRLPDDDCYVQVPLLNEDTGKLIMQTYLKHHNRTVTKEQDQYLLSVFNKAPSPLFLKLLLDEARKWNSYTPVEDLVLAPTVKEAINSLFQKLENKFGFALVSHALGYITVGLSGLTEFEIEDALSCDDEVLNEVYKFHDPPVPGLVRIPPVLWARIRYDIREYLVERMAHGKNTLNWYHRQFIETATERYLQKGAAERLHRNLVSIYLQEDGYKRTITLEKRNNLTIENADRQVTPQPFSAHNKRKLACLPYHTLQSHRLIGIENAKASVYLNYKFLCTRISAFSVAVVCSDLRDFHEMTKDEEVFMLLNYLQTSKDDLTNQVRFAVCLLAYINPAEGHTHLKALQAQAREYLDTKTKPMFVPDFPCLAPRLDASSAFQTSLQGYSDILAWSCNYLLLKVSTKKDEETKDENVELKSDYAIWCSETQDLKQGVFEGLNLCKGKVCLNDTRAFCVSNNKIVTYNFAKETSDTVALSDIFPNFKENDQVLQFISDGEDVGALILQNMVVLVDLDKLKFMQKFEIKGKPVAFENAFVLNDGQTVVMIGKVNNSSADDQQGPENQSFICLFNRAQEKPEKFLELEDSINCQHCMLLGNESWFVMSTRFDFPEKLVPSADKEGDKSSKLLVYRLKGGDCKKEIKLPGVVSKMFGHSEKTKLFLLTSSGKVYHIQFYELSDKVDVLVVLLDFEVVDFAVSWEDEIGYLCSGGGTVVIYDFKSERKLGAFSAHPTVLKEILLLEQQFITLSAADELKVWSVQQLLKDVCVENTKDVPVGEMLLDQMNVTAILPLSNGNEILTCHEDEIVKIWSLRSHQCERQFKVGLVANLVHNLVDDLVALHDTTAGKVKIVDAITGNDEIELPSTLENIMFSTTNKASDSLYLISAPKKGKEQIDIVSIPLRKISKTIHLQGGLTYESVDICLSALEDYVVIRHRISEKEFGLIKDMWKKGGFGEQDHRYRFTAVAVTQGTGALKPCFRQQSKIPLLGVCVQPYKGGAMLISTRRWLVFWDIPTGKCDQKPSKVMKTGMFYRPEWIGQNCKGANEVFEQTENLKYVVCGSEDGYVFVYNAETGIPVGDSKPTSRHSAEVHCLRTSPNSKWVASACRSSVLKLWECATGAEQFSVRLDAQVQSMHFTPDSLKLVLFTGTFTTRVLIFSISCGKKSITS